MSGFLFRYFALFVALLVVTGSLGCTKKRAITDDSITNGKTPGGGGGDGGGTTKPAVASCSTVGEVLTVSRNAAGQDGNSVSSDAWLSRDGSLVAFLSMATNLVPGVTGQQIYLRNLTTGALTLQTLSTNGGTINFGYAKLGAPVLSRLGNRLFFSTSVNMGLAAPANDTWMIYSRNLSTGTLSLVTITSSGVFLPTDSRATPSVSEDGRYVAFRSKRLASGATSDKDQILVKDLVTGSVTLASADSAGVAGNNTSYLDSPLVLSPDGSRILFHSYATNLGFPAAAGQSFLKDLNTGALTQVFGLGNTVGNYPATFNESGTAAYFAMMTNPFSGAYAHEFSRLDLTTGARSPLTWSPGYNGAFLWGFVSTDEAFLAVTVSPPGAGVYRAYRYRVATGLLEPMDLLEGGSTPPYGTYTIARGMAGDGRRVIYTTTFADQNDPEGSTTNTQVMATCLGD